MKPVIREAIDRVARNSGEFGYGGRPKTLGTPCENVQFLADLGLGFLGHAWVAPDFWVMPGSCLGNSGVAPGAGLPHCPAAGLALFLTHFLERK